MEASKFGFGRDLSPAFKFDPTDADIVAYYLLPRALGLPNPYAHAVIEDDPGSATPWELLEKYGGGKIDHAFFFGPPRDPTKKGGRQARTVKGGGVWQGQKAYEGTVTLLRPGGGEVDITFKRYNLTFHRTKRGPSTGYVMHEYEITSPPLPGTVLTRIRINQNKKAKMEKAAAAAAGVGQKVLFPEYDAAVMACNGEGFGTAQQAGAFYGGNGGDMAETGGYYYTPLNCVLPEIGYDDYRLPVTDQLGASHNAAAMKTDNQGFTGAQADAFYGGGMVETGGANYDPSQFVPVGGGEGINYYGQYQQGSAPWPYQPDQHHNHNPYYAEDAAVMCSGDEGFGIEQQACAPPGYVGDAAVICSGDGGFSVERQACALPGYVGDAVVVGSGDEGQASTPCGYAGDDVVMGSGDEGFGVEQQACALPGYVGDAAGICSGDDGFSVERQACALPGYVGDAVVVGSGDEGQASTPCGYAGDDVVMGSGGEGFSVEQQTGALCGCAANDAVMCSGGEGFSVEQKAGADCGQSDNGSVMGTESAQSTISHCDDGEEENWDDLYDALYGDNGGGFSCELSGAGDAATDREWVN